MKSLKMAYAKLLLNEKGANDVAVYGVLLLFSLIVCAFAFPAINTPLQTGVNSVTGTMTNTFTTIGAL